MMMSHNSFLSQKLIFDDTGIFFHKKDRIEFVMNSCEDSLMKRTVDVLVNEGDDLLEIGFGMGIFSTYAQEKKLNSHTIVEGHPQIFEKLLAWSKDKENVNIIFGDWVKVLHEIKRHNYNCVYFDTHNDVNIFDFFKKIKHSIKSNGRFSRFGLNIEDQNLIEREFGETDIKILTNEYHQVNASGSVNYVKNNNFPICVIGL